MAECTMREGTITAPARYRHCTITALSLHCDCTRTVTSNERDWYVRDSCIGGGDVQCTTRAVQGAGVVMGGNEETMPSAQDGDGAVMVQVWNSDGAVPWCGAGTVTGM